MSWQHVFHLRPFIAPQAENWLPGHKRPPCTDGLLRTGIITAFLQSGGTTATDNNWLKSSVRGKTRICLSFLNRAGGRSSGQEKLFFMRLIANSTSDSAIVTDVKQLLSSTISEQSGKFHQISSTIPTLAKYLLNSFAYSVSSVRTVLSLVTMAPIPSLWVTGYWYSDKRHQGF